VIHHITRATRHLIFWLLIITAIGITALRVSFVEIESYKSELADYLGGLIGVPIKIGRLTAKMRGFSPELILKDIEIASISTAAQSAIQLDEIRLGLSFPSLLLSQHILSSTRLSLVGTKLTLQRKADGQIIVAGLKASDEQPLWLMQGGQIELLHSQITWDDQLGKLKPVKFEKVDLAIRNTDDGQQHWLNMRIPLPAAYGKSLALAMDFKGSVFAPQALVGKAFIEAKQIHLAEWVQADFFENVALKAATGDFKVWCDLQQGLPVVLTGLLDVSHIEMQRAAVPTLKIEHLKSSFQWRKTAELWRLDVQDLQLQLAEQAKLPLFKPQLIKLSVSENLNQATVGQNVAIYVDAMEVQDAFHIAQFFLAENQSSLFAQTQLSGKLSDFAAIVNWPQRMFALNGHIDHFSFAAGPTWPAFKNLSMTIRGDQNHGNVSINTENAQLALADFLPTPLAIGQLKGRLNWQQTETAWMFSSRQLKFDLTGFNSTSRFQFNWPKLAAVEPFIDMQLAYSSTDVSQLSQYLPRLAMNKRTVAWLDSAFTSGQLTNGELLFYGKPNDFPFKQGAGVFEASFKLENLALQFEPSWPLVTEASAQVEFVQDHLQVNFDKGLAGENNIKFAEISVEELNKSDYLSFDGLITGEINQVLQFMQQSPLQKSISSVRDAIYAEGETQIDLALKIPLELGLPTKVEGAAHFNNAKLTVKSLDLPIKNISGDLKLNDHGVYANLLNATALGNPIQVTVDNSGLETDINISGHTGISNLQAQFELPWWHLAEGAAAFQIALSLPHDQRPPELLVQSDLLGIALDLPGVLGKTVSEKEHLNLTFKLLDEPLMPIKVQYADKLKAALKLNVKQQSLYSGHVLIGDGAVSQRDQPGLKFEVNREHLALQDWLALAANSALDNSAPGGFSENIKEISFHSPNANWKDKPLGRYELNLTRTDSAWLGNIDSVIATGDFVLPLNWQGNEVTQLKMQKLDLSALTQLGAGGGSDKRIKSLPLITLSSQQTLWHSINLGQLSLSAERITDGIHFKELALTAPGLQLSLNGDWVADAAQAKTAIQGKLVSERFGALLSQLGITDDITETSAILEFALNWPGAPQQFALANLKGHLDADLKEGRILSIEPGFGRILGILALSQWIKRLQLDFGDIYKEGLTFNAIKGHFDLLKGIAKTNNLLIDSVPAKINIVGIVDLAHKRVDQTVQVLPKSSDALPIAGTIVDKLSNLIARSLTGKNQEGLFFSSQYQIKGNWDQAEIIPLHDNEGIINKTWNGIVSFPWLQQEE
jgi:uncharacterized protein (TIGR02099 family)